MRPRGMSRVCIVAIITDGPIFRLWHKAGNPLVATNVRFRTTAGNGGYWPAMVCPLLTPTATFCRLPACEAGGEGDALDEAKLKLDAIVAGGSRDWPLWTRR